MKNKKEKIRSQARVSQKVGEFLSEFETAFETFKFVDVSSKRSQYNRDVDEAFFTLAKNTIEKLAKLIVLTNAYEMYHLHEYRQTILKHKEDIKNIYEKINDIKL